MTDRVGEVHICSHSGSTCGICCMVAETVCVMFSEHTCRLQHDAPDSALICYVHVCNISKSCAKSYCGATYNTSLYTEKKAVFNILIFLSNTSDR